MNRKYIDINDNEINVKNIKKHINTKDILKYEPRLIMMKDNSIVYELENIQTLYLYPLSLLDYINNLKNKDIISINIIKIKIDIDYIKLFSNQRFKNLKSVEILIKDTYNENEYIKIFEIIEYLYSKKIKISLNIKDLNKISNKFYKYYKYISYFKIFLPNILNTDKFINNLKLISEYKSTNSLLHIKSYLDIEQVYYYQNALEDFSKYDVNIFQVSKELLPLELENIEVDVNVQKIVRELEKKYNSYSRTKFISVKDISTLYYPRFELDERNSKRCYACKMKPYLYNDMILPCKVRKIMNNLDKWSNKYNEVNKYNKIVTNCGTKCDDCASIFENDVLNEIEILLEKEKYDNIKFLLQIGEDND